MMNKTTITVSDEVWRYLHDKKDLGDSMDDVLRREFGLIDENDEHEEEHDQPEEQLDEPEFEEQPSEIQELLRAWRPGRDAEEREQIKADAIEGVEWVRDQNYAVAKSDVIAAVYDENEIEVAADSWWRKRVRKALDELEEQGLVKKDGRKYRYVG